MADQILGIEAGAQCFDSVTVVTDVRWSDPDHLQLTLDRVYWPYGQLRLQDQPLEVRLHLEQITYLSGWLLSHRAPAPHLPCVSGDMIEETLGFMRDDPWPSRSQGPGLVKQIRLTGARNTAMRIGNRRDPRGLRYLVLTPAERETLLELMMKAERPAAD